MTIDTNMDIFQGKWRQIKGQVQQQWGKFTNDDLEQIEGRYEELVGLVQERYGRTRADAEREVRDFLDKVS